ncbi:lipoprotein [Candidatus Magnetobacterium bavaricum]|uniref:Lipoprotein n=1 Tax=Candidatus Magnetobacterium bavaricum TaxID=29290 RepID=A0A0F3GYQ4_9BACT|nr:lipoprotein [Candidatus Magnetobacterium bavaricum]
MAIAGLILWISVLISCVKSEEPKPEIPVSSQKLLESKSESKEPKQSPVPEVPPSGHAGGSDQHKAETPHQDGKASNAGGDQHASEGAHTSDGGETRHSAEIVVPDSVKGKWESVKLSITDKQDKKSQVINVKLGSEYTVQGSDLKINIGDFLPDFKMDALTITSMSNEKKNPAVNVKVTESGKEIFKGWLYSKYPEIHPFQHDRYGIILMDGIQKN